ncbi:MAG TPA: metallophosphoesterase [Gaiellaceae bacterium]|nr:metallophosphoesterase [Gaiellaceae bacterium]
MTERVTDPPQPVPVPTDPTHSSRTSRRSAGWVDCKEAAQVRDLYREGYEPESFNWINPKPIWESRNDPIARVIEDPTDDERRRWVAAMRKKGVDPDLTVRRYSEADELSFLVIGDPGEGDASQYHVLRPLRSKAGGTLFTYVVSDVIYPAGDVNEYEDKFFWPYRELPGPIYAIPGNHDWYDGLHGFMTHFCRADPAERPEPKQGGRVRRALRNVLWRQPSKPDQQLLERVGKLRQERSEQPGPYFAIDTGPLLIVGIDTGIRGKLDREQGDWLRRISKVPKPKLLLTGKPLVVDAGRKETEIEGGGGVRPIVDDPAHRYIAVIGGDIHNYQRYPVKMPDGRTIQHIVSGAAGAYTKATHKIPKVKPEVCGCSEDDFRCYPRRGDSLAAYSRLYDRKFGLGRGYLVVPYQQAPAIMSQLLEGKIEPTRSEDVEQEITQQAWKAAKRITRFPGSSGGAGGGMLHRNFSELLDWNDPPPPLFKSFLRIDVKQGELELQCFAATGCAEHADDPPLEDWIRGREQPDGTWEWEVLLD